MECGEPKISNLVSNLTAGIHSFSKATTFLPGGEAVMLKIHQQMGSVL